MAIKDFDCSFFKLIILTLISLILDVFERLYEALPDPRKFQSNFKYLKHASAINNLGIIKITKKDIKNLFTHRF